MSPDAWAWESIVREEAARVPEWMRDDVESEIRADVLAAGEPVTRKAVRAIARATAGRMRGREQRRRHLHGAALDGAQAGASDGDAVLDQVASRILLDAAVSAANAGFDFSSSRMRGGVSKND